VTKGPVLIVGARSDIGLATAHAFARQGRPVQLAARNVSSLEADASDIAIRHGVETSLHECDVLDPSTCAGWPASLPELPEIVVCAAGVLGIQEDAEKDADIATTVMRTNFEGPAVLLGLFASAFLERGSGTIVGISSVAGERGRASNYIYGSAKAGFTAWLSGLRARLSRHGVQVITVIPGFVDTRMTEGMDLPRKLTATPEQVAAAIVSAVTKQRDVIYVLPVWRLIMAIIRALPERVFKKLKI